MTPRGGLIRSLGLHSATALVVANIIGAGIFTSTGFQAAALGHPGWIFLLWIVGGVLALCGALCYAELGAMMPQAGAEYVYLRETYGRMFGFMSAVVSLTAGFSAPIASAAKGFVAYAAYFVPGLQADTTLLGFLHVNDLVAAALVWGLVAIHWRGMKGGIGFNDLVTLFKLCGIVAIILGAAALGKGSFSNFTEIAPSYAGMSMTAKTSAFATSLIFVMFCYSGWNAAAYMAGEMKTPQRDLPRALLLGTGIVVVLYMGLNTVYFYGAGVSGLAGQAEVGQVAAEHLFGPTGVKLVTLVCCISILASASAMVIAGPRVYYAFGKDFGPFSPLTEAHATTGAPTIALLVQGVVTTLIIFSGTIDQIQQYSGFTLSLFASLAVSCVIILRLRKPNLERPFRAWGYPVTPLLFLCVMAWTMYWAAGGRPKESLLGLATVIVAGIAFQVMSRFFPETGEGE